MPGPEFLFWKSCSQAEKRNSGTDVSCEFWEILKNTFFIEYLWATASD